MRAALTRLVALLLIVPALAGAAEQRGPSTPAERKKALELTRKLERDPLGKTSDADRRWLLQWIIAIPDIQVKSCSGPLNPLLEDREHDRFGPELYTQSIFGMAAFLIEHPKRKDDWVAVQTAGIESVLRAYERLVAKEPDARWEELDALLRVRKKGKLAALVRKTMAECPKEEEGMGPLPEGTI